MFACKSFVFIFNRKYFQISMNISITDCENYKFGPNIKSNEIDLSLSFSYWD